MPSDQEFNLGTDLDQRVQERTELRPPPDILP